MRQIIKQAGRAISDFQLIEEGDRIAVGVSGGKDSLVLLKTLAHFKRVSPKKFDLFAVTVDMGLSGMDLSPITEFCRSFHIQHHILPSRIAEIVFDIREEKNPCALCANLRRGALHDGAKKLSANKVALGHHREDAVETLMMSMLYEGRINCFKPKTYLSRQDITVIRPLVYVKEQSIITEVKEQGYTIVKSTCPACGNTGRQRVKELLTEMEKDFPLAKHHLLLSLSHVELQNLWLHQDKEE